MTARRTIILNSLLTLILVASIYQFTKSESLTGKVDSIDRNMQRAQRQIADLKDAASSTFEQTMRRFDDFGQQLSQIAQTRKTAAAKVAATAPAAGPNGTPASSHAPRGSAAPAAHHAARAAQSAQNVCDFPCYRRMLLPLLSKIVESAGYTVVKDQNAAAPQTGSAALASPQTPYDQRRDQEANLSKDLVDFCRCAPGFATLARPPPHPTRGSPVATDAPGS